MLIVWIDNKMYCKTFITICYCFFTSYAVTVMGNPVKMKPGYFDPQNPDTSLAFPDFLLPRTEYPIRPKVCMYKSTEYPDGTIVATDEPCLKCKCLGGSLICYLRVCPTMPEPPPPHCLLVLRKGACCSELICEDGGLSTNHISSRSEPDMDHPIDSTISFNEGKGCIDNGTLYASGSAMSTSSLCEYCYCIAGAQHCVRPKCLLPVPGCQPRRSPHSCCPVSYTCSNNMTSTSTTASPPFIPDTGCIDNGILYPEGERVLSKETPCTNCFCIRGKVKCAQLSCAPALLGCVPIILPGHCCASSYNCSNHTSTLVDFTKISDSVKDMFGDEDIVINERSFPDDTLLTPSQIAEILLGSERRSTRNNPEKQKGDKKNSRISVSIISTPEEIITPKKSLNTSNTLVTNKISTTSPTIIQVDLKSRVMLNKTDVDSSQKQKQDKNSDESKHDNYLIPQVKKNSKPDNESDYLTALNDRSSEDVTSDEGYTSITTVVVNDSINCTTEITSVDSINISDTVIDNTTDSILPYIDTQERRPISSGLIVADESEGHDEDNLNDDDSKSDVNVGSQYPSHSLIIPKDDDVFMVNVSTFVRTNTSVVTLKPVAAIPPEIEAILNMTVKNQKDDYYDYDYKSALPPSLPNLEIIPFLATDAVVNEKKAEKKKPNIKYENVYPEEDTKVFTYPPIDRRRFNNTLTPYVHSTTNSPYSANKYFSSPPISYNRNPVYRQHINDKFKATTQTPIEERIYDTQYAPKIYEDSSSSNSEEVLPVHENKGINLFSPPIKTEGGFLPREPPSDSYYGLDISPTGDESYSATDSSLMVTNQAKITGDNCISNGKEYKNKELITEPNSCVVCFCYYGDIHCQDPECPPIKPGCRRKIEKGSTSCCGIEICNDGIFNTKNNVEIDTKKSVSTPTTTVSTTTKNTETTPTLLIEKTYNKQRIPGSTTPRSETSTDHQSINHKEDVKESTSSESTTSSILSESAIISSTQSSITLTKSENKPLTEKSGNGILDSKKVFEIKTPSSNVETYVTENYLYKEPPQDESDPFAEDDNEEEEDDDGFNFASVWSYLLGEDTTTKPVTKVYTTSPTTTSTLFFNPSPKSRLPTSTIRVINTPPLTTSIKSIIATSERVIPNYSTQNSVPPKLLSSLVPFKITPSPMSPPSFAVKSTHKYTFTKPQRNVTLVPLLKNISKIKANTKAPIIYSTLNRFTKIKYPTNPFTIPTEPTRKIPPTYYPSDSQQSYKKKPSSPSESALPFGSGGLKLAGCNIYGRMYRVGKIISELSGPCLQCMCTEVGVDCRSVFGPNC